MSGRRGETKMETKKSRLADSFLYKVNADECVIGIHISEVRPGIVEVAGRMGFDYVQISQEHTNLSSQSLLEILPVADLAELVSLVKLNHPDPKLAVDAIDAGAMGVVVPYIESAAQLREFFQGTKFPPLGNRGMCPNVRAALWSATNQQSYSKETGKGQNPVLDEYFEFVNEHMIVVPMIESVDGVDNLDEILAVPGYSIIEIGLADLVLSLANAGFDNPARKAITVGRAVAKKCREAGKKIMLTMSLREDEESMLAELVGFEVTVPLVIDYMSLVFGFHTAQRMGAKGVAEISRRGRE